MFANGSLSLMVHGKVFVTGGDRWFDDQINEKIDLKRSMIDLNFIIKQIQSDVTNFFNLFLFIERKQDSKTKIKIQIDKW